MKQNQSTKMLTNSTPEKEFQFAEKARKALKWDQPGSYAKTPQEMEHELHNVMQELNKVSEGPSVDRLHTHNVVCCLKYILDS